MRVTFKQSTVLNCWVHEQGEDTCTRHVFLKGESYRVEMIDDGDTESVIEFARLGCATVPNHAWQELTRQDRPELN